MLARTAHGTTFALVMVPAHWEPSCAREGIVPRTLAANAAAAAAFNRHFIQLTHSQGRYAPSQCLANRTRTYGVGASSRSRSDEIGSGRPIDGWRRWPVWSLLVIEARELRFAPEQRK